MLLSEIFDQLAFGELSQLNVGGNNSGVIATDDYPKILTLINSGILELYTRFDLKWDSLILDLYDQISFYHLHEDFAASSGSAEPIKYINDTGAETPFTNNIIMVTNVYDELGGELPLNRAEDVKSVFTPESNIIQVLYPVTGNSIEVVYKASPVKLDTSATDLTITVPLPNHFLNAIVAYVAQVIFRTINTSDEGTETGAFVSLFEAAAARIDHLGLVNVDEHVNHKLGDNGWV